MRSNPLEPAHVYCKTPFLALASGLQELHIKLLIEVPNIDIYQFLRFPSSIKHITQHTAAMSLSAQSSGRQRSPSDTPTLHDNTDHSLKKRPWRRYVTPWEQIRDHKYEGEGTDEKPFIVDWIPEGDAENPMTWGKTYKWSVIMLVAVSTLAVAMASSTL